MVSMKR